MHRRLLEILADPITGEPLQLVNDDGREDIETGELRGSRSYWIRNGIPRFVDDESYVDSFGLQWNRFATVQLDSHNGGTFSRDRFLNETGWTRETLEGNWVIDAGCGAGRFSEIAAELGAEVVSVDMSSAVDAARANLKDQSHVHFIQADIARLPIRRQHIRFLYSLGVLQHTEDPLKIAAELVSVLADNGQFAFTVYARRPWTKLNGKYVIRPLTTRINQQKLLRIIERSMVVIFPATNYLFRLPVLGSLFRFVIPVANYVERIGVMPEETRYQEAILDTFDMLSPKYDCPVTAEEFDRAIGPIVSRLDFQSRVPLIARGWRSRDSKPASPGADPRSPLRT